MIITFLITIAFVVVLLILSGLSIYLALSGSLPGHTQIGWVLLAVYMVVYMTFAFGWLGRIGGSALSVYSIILLILLLAPQIPLVIGLLGQALIPDPSKGLKLLKVHSEAEKWVNQDDLPAAITEYEKVIAEDPDDIDARVRLAELFCQSEEYRKAATTYGFLLRHPKKLGMARHCSVLTRLSDIYAHNLDDIDTARRHIREIIDTYPNTTYARYAMDRLDNL